MERKLDNIIDNRKTVLLPEKADSDCYAVYSKEEFENAEEQILVDGKAYKHRLYLYKKTKNTASDKTLTFIFLNPGRANHIEQDCKIDDCIKLAAAEYGAIEIFSLFTLRTIDLIDSVTENAILDVIRADLSQNDIVLDFGGEITPTEKYKNISDEDLKKINKVRNIKIKELINFLSGQKHSGKIFELKNGCLIEFKQK